MLPEGGVKNICFQGVLKPVATATPSHTVHLQRNAGEEARANGYFGNGGVETASVL